MSVLYRTIFPLFPPLPDATPEYISERLIPVTLSRAHTRHDLSNAASYQNLQRAPLPPLYHALYRFDCTCCPSRCASIPACACLTRKSSVASLPGSRFSGRHKLARDMEALQKVIRRPVLPPTGWAGLAKCTTQFHFYQRNQPLGICGRLDTVY